MGWPRHTKLTKYIERKRAEKKLGRFTGPVNGCKNCRGKLVSNLSQKKKENEEEQINESLNLMGVAKWHGIHHSTIRFG